MAVVLVTTCGTGTAVRSVRNEALYLGVCLFFLLYDPISFCIKFVFDQATCTLPGNEGECVATDATRRQPQIRDAALLRLHFVRLFFSLLCKSCRKELHATLVTTVKLNVNSNRCLLFQPPFFQLTGVLYHDQCAQLILHNK